MSENQLLLQTLEVAFNQVYAAVCSVPDHSDIHTPSQDKASHRTWLVLSSHLSTVGFEKLIHWWDIRSKRRIWMSIHQRDVRKQKLSGLTRLTCAFSLKVSKCVWYDMMEMTGISLTAGESLGSRDKDCNSHSAEPWLHNPFWIRLIPFKIHLLYCSLRYPVAIISIAFSLHTVKTKFFIVSLLPCES